MSQSPRPRGGRQAARSDDLEPARDHEGHRTPELEPVPPEGLDEPSHEDELVDADVRRASEHLDRILGDVDLRLRLQLRGYADAEWNPVAAEFARYGLAVMKSWIRRGRIFSEVKAATGFWLTEVPHEWLAPEVVEDLATDTVMNALGAFRRIALEGGSWDPNKGASMKTYFIGQCKRQFPNVYRDWSRAEGRRRGVMWSLDDLVDKNVLAPAHNSVEQEFDRYAEIEDALGQVSTPLARSAFMYQAEGYSLEDIAMILGLRDAKAVENLLGHQRRQVASRRQQNSAQSERRRPA
jgi:DNA-directed RNA polymerase specialized sigma24 family protein